jgi:hypothetical protein
VSPILQVRLSLPAFSSGIAFSDPIIMEMADSISLSKTVNSDVESISFTVPLTDPKIIYVTYLRWWECWDTETNTRLNYGPIKDISGQGGQPKTVTGPGRSAALGEFYKSIQTFYYPINQFFDDLRYENIAGEPRTSTIINKATDSEYYGLSKRTKDYAIDEQTGFISIGRDTPDQGTIKSDVFWSGTGKSDYLTVDLGDKYTISKSKVLLPWWSGPTTYNTRTYDWDWSYSNDNGSYTSLYTSPVGAAFGAYGMDPSIGGVPIYTGESGFEPKQITVSGAFAIEAQYWKINIADTHAWYGSALDGTQADEWAWECGESNTLLGETEPSPTISGGIIPKTDLNPSSDCHASVVELGIYRKIIDRDNIPNLVYHQIQNDNRQITFYHVPKAEEMITAGSSKKFEPGSFFRNVTWTGSGTVKDEYNTTIYSGAGAALECPAYSRLLLFSDSSAQVTEADTWMSITDAFSYGGSYSYTDVDRDYATLHFRGVSLKWFATVPEGVTAGQVSIELRAKADDGSWGGWSTLDTIVLPTGVSAEKVFEITYESGTLSDETVYELRITNLNGGYVSIDAFAGYWSASFSEINQDDSRFRMQLPSEALPMYNQIYTFGSVYEYKDKGHLAKMGFHFTGDRIIVYAKKGINYGRIQIALWNTTGDALATYPIPGGEADGSLIVDLESTFYVPQAVIFDSNKFFTAPGLPWAHHWLAIYKPTDINPIWIDGVGVHETSGLSVKFVNTSHLDILKNTCEALQLEWDITENGILITPRLGTDTDEIYAEGRGTTISIQDDEDASQIATMLISSGSDIDGLPLTTVVENKVTRTLFGRTIQRLYDFRNIGDYFTLIGASRTELLRRRAPQKKITITDAPGPLRVNLGDSFIAKKSDLEVQVRLITTTRNQSSSEGTTYSMECIEWPQIT